ncbi:DNA-directed RNA polymerase I subunit RPA49 [Sporobolomyces salmoneus]|uniref:DNA-directed RNA polymerase I subunit RPA49 n=1 Tax=Sporobolomyces salmoneus TaxID=183962 RepID=UPI003174CD83
MSDSRKRQKGPQGQPIHVAIASTSTSAPSPALALFPSAQPPSKTPYSLYTHGESQSLLAAETDDIEFESRNHIGEAAEEAGGEERGYSTEYMIGVHNPRTNTLTLHSSPLHLFTPSIKSLKPTPESLASRDHQSLMTAQRALLGSTFGTKKAIRALNAQQRNKLNQESFGTGSSSKLLQQHLQSSIQQSSAHLPTVESIELTANEARPIPPFNLEAETPAQVYALEHLLSPAELNSIDLSPFLSAPTNKERLAMLPGKKPDFIWTKFKQILPARNEVEGSIPNPKKQDRERLKLLIHLAYLFRFKETVFAGTKSLDRSKLVERLGNPAPIVVDSLIDRYTEGIRTSGGGGGGGEQRKMTSFMEQKLLSYLLVIVLRIDGYSTDIDSIAHDLAIGPPKIREVFRSLGCQIVAPSAVDREKLVTSGFAKTTAEAGKMKKATLKVPLEFPKERKGRAKK